MLLLIKSLQPIITFIFIPLSSTIPYRSCNAALSLDAPLLSRSRIRYSEQDFLGEAIIFLSDLDAVDMDKWYRLDGKERLGQLTIKLHSATNLCAADSNGLSDPYVEIQMGKKVGRGMLKRVVPACNPHLLPEVCLSSALDCINSVGGTDCAGKA